MTYKKLCDCFFPNRLQHVKQQFKTLQSDLNYTGYRSASGICDGLFDNHNSNRKGKYYNIK